MRQAIACFRPILDELVAELPALRQPVGRVSGRRSKARWRGAWSRPAPGIAGVFVTPMAGGRRCRRRRGAGGDAGRPRVATRLRQRRRRHRPASGAGRVASTWASSPRSTARRLPPPRRSRRRCRFAVSPPAARAAAASPSASPMPSPCWPRRRCRRCRRDPDRQRRRYRQPGGQPPAGACREARTAIWATCRWWLRSARSPGMISMPPWRRDWRRRSGCGRRD